MGACLRAKGPTRQPTPEEYERAISRCERAFKANKTRMWPLVILRELIQEEVDGARDL